MKKRRVPTNNDALLSSPIKTIQQTTKASNAMENLENNNEDDANVHGDVAMNNETGNGNANEDEDEDEDNNTGGQVVEEYVSTLADFHRIRHQYGTVDDEIPFCLNIVSYSIQNIPDQALWYRHTLTDLRVLQRGPKEDQIILRTIGARAFEMCRNLRRINQFLKEGGVIRLGNRAFALCDRIEGELIIPGSVLYVGDACFRECTSITSVVFEPSTMGTVVEINYVAFCWCTELSSATLPPNLERIPRSCFRGCTALITVPIPPTVVELEERSFHGCTSLPSMELPESVDVIGKEAFLDCTALTTVTIRTTSFVRMGDNVFGGCTALTTLRTYPWQWGQLLSSMKNDATFLNKFFNGTLTPLHQIDLTFFGPHILEAVKDQPSLLYRFLRKFQHQRFETNALRTTMTTVATAAAAATAATAVTAVTATSAPEEPVEGPTPILNRKSKFKKSSTSTNEGGTNGNR